MRDILHSVFSRCADRLFIEMTKELVNFVFVVHNHQPVGNFDHVFANAADDAYLPFLRLLLEYPEIKIGLHTSGCLWDWLKRNRPEYIELARELSSRDQIEIIGGGYYEPILTLLPERDIVRQFARMNHFLVENFGVMPEGFWSTERVWEPSLPYFLRNTGVCYTLLDDNHFISSGFCHDELRKPFKTSHLRYELMVFPISEKLRYYIPFRDVRALEDLLRKIAKDTPGCVQVFGDDGEKFGVWPGTVDWVWKRGWIRDFFDMLKSNADWIITHQPAQFLKDNPARETVFLPATSYREMTGWALPPRSAYDFEQTWKKLEKLPDDAPERRFFRGGYFANYLTKYAESARIHREMLFVSDLLAEHGEKLDSQVYELAEKSLHEGQCNCAYWHGVFGGLYLNYLRHAVYKNLIAAKRFVYDALGVLPAKVRSGFYRLSNGSVAFEVNLVEGVIEAIDFLPAASRITDVLTRRYEGYHERIALAQAGNEGDHESIHGGLKVKEAGLQDFLFYDRRTRCSFDVFLAKPEVSAERLMQGNFEYLDCTYCPAWDAHIDERSVELSGKLELVDDIGSIAVQKRISICDKASKLDFELAIDGSNLASAIEAEIGIVFDFGLLAGDAQDRYYDLPDSKERLLYIGDVEDTDSISLVDAWQGIRITVSSEEQCAFRLYPIETVSASEGGLERTYQGSSVNLCRKNVIGPGAERILWRFSVTIESSA